jgi:hypothetical protein
MKTFEQWSKEQLTCPNALCRSRNTSAQTGSERRCEECHYTWTPEPFAQSSGTPSSPSESST